MHILSHFYLFLIAELFCSAKLSEGCDKGAMCGNVVTGTRETGLLVMFHARLKWLAFSSDLISIHS